MRKPANELLPQRPVLGLCAATAAKVEPSGKRVWELFRNLYGAVSPTTFFASAGVLNLCPLAFFRSVDGRTVSPEEFPSEIRNRVVDFCNKHLLEILVLLEVKRIVCFGRFVEKCAKQLTKTQGWTGQIIYVPHPSPRSVNNQHWVRDTEAALREKLFGFAPEETPHSQNGGGH